ncbi:MAG: Fic family protein [Rectinemataceae bacterium]
MKTVGYAWLINEYRLEVLGPALLSYLHERSDRRSLERDGQIESHYPRNYDPGDMWEGNLMFALKYEGINLEVLAALFPKLDPADVEAFVRASPIGKYARFVWFFYEFFLGQRLGFKDLGRGNYIPILDEEQEFSLPKASAPRAKRQRLIVNLLGGKEYCPRIRKTKGILEFEEADIVASVRALVASYPESLIERASRYLYAKETKSSFEIERERPDNKRTAKFVELLRRAGRTDPYEESGLTALQNVIVEERYAATGYRTSQNYVGESIGPTRELVHFIPPKPDALGPLMAGWTLSCRHIRSNGMEALVLATVAGFGFVFLHPFDDGNGRIHRFLIHDALISSGFTPEGMIFPVSAVMLRRMKEYDAALEAYSTLCMEHLHYVLDEKGAMTVEGETSSFYRYPDLTRQAEALASFIRETAQTEFSAELEYLTLFDKASESVRSILDMPDRKLELFVRLCIQGTGKLSASKRGLFSELNDAELASLENAVVSIMAEQSRMKTEASVILD